MKDLFARIPFRWRLAGGSAVLTLVILLAFAIAVGVLTSRRIHSEFESNVAGAATRLSDSIRVEPIIPGTYRIRFRPNLTTFVRGEGAAARLVVAETGRVVRASRGAPDLGPVIGRSVEYRGFRIENRPVGELPGIGHLYIQYGRSRDSVEATVRRVRLFLVGGVVGGAGLALLAGLMVAKRAMRPIVELTHTARRIEQTRDPNESLPEPGPADDEISDLSRTLEQMLHALAESRSEQEAMLLRQREFVADASHELRTPLTSVLANLDFLAETLHGEQGDAARSALRSSHRMRRLVQDLLLLARADARRAAPHQPLDVAQVVVEAAGELEPVTNGHVLSVDAQHAMVDGARDELHRLVLNLMENAIKHTPEGTHVRAAVERSGGAVRLVVEDDGPGIPADLRDKVFERFVRGAGDRGGKGGSFGLGLAIVRAVAESHGGEVELGTPAAGHGTRFVVRLPLADGDRQPEAPADRPVAAGANVRERE